MINIFNLKTFLSKNKKAILSIAGIAIFAILIVGVRGIWLNALKSTDVKTSNEEFSSDFTPSLEENISHPFDETSSTIENEKQVEKNPETINEDVSSHECNKPEEKLTQASSEALSQSEHKKSDSPKGDEINKTNSHNYQYPKNEGMKVHFINVGKADSALITCKGKNILIDAGDKDGSNTVVEYLQRKHVTNLDLAIATHPHRDHIGQMSNVINEIPVQRFLMPKKRAYGMNAYKDLLNALKKKSITIENPLPGSEIKIGDMKIHILAPNAEYNDANDCSIVVKIEYGEKKFLFTGDAGRTSEHDMMNKGYNLQADVLKVGHHGKDCASSWHFIKAVNPKYAVISTGSYNSTSHKESLVDKKVLDYLGWVKSKVYRTDHNGTIVISTDGKDLKVDKERG